MNAEKGGGLKGSTSEWERNENIPFPKFRNKKGSEKKLIPKIWEQEGNENI